MDPKRKIDPTKTTVEYALEDLATAKKELNAVRFTLQETNSFADGPRFDLVGAFETIEKEIDRSIAYWSAP